ncbi:hypothetical protein H696_02752 [Fonticula alba]|uniref:Growth factor receptor domain-containing protein n=1 Tax=Fonticula alba TaxID=691883 RepID=A0A058Z8H1_FONAL|nr:hypothetical protein H696_02752 [Fonticula alba]KCV70411.1 hypothetical protein H696_02752 [Fonticula alba]|eukprot:XP_009494927.1 hypothetical protein H696_02752 [Fonticula alba]
MRYGASARAPAGALMLVLLIFAALAAMATPVANAADCATGQFADTEGNCQPCHPSCSSCDDATSCFACRPGLGFLSPDPTIGSLCTANCPFGRYGWKSENPSPTPPGPRQTFFCYECGPRCTTCTGPDYPPKCHSCTANVGLTDVNMCTSSNNLPSWHDPASKRYIHCHPSCESCTGPGPDSCLTCVSGWRLEPGGNGAGTCVSDCPVGSYLPSGSSSSQCAACHSNCRTCFGPGATQCLSCNSQRPIRNRQCVEACGTGFYRVGGECHACHPSCGQCTGPADSQCIGDCSPMAFRLSAGEEDHSQAEFTCVTMCPKGTGRTADRKCLPCEDSCAACWPDDAPGAGNRMVCRKCEDGWFLDKSIGACVLACPNGTTAIGAECMRCKPGCAACYGEGDGQCVACQEDLPVHWQGDCWASCPEGFYESGGTCVACHESCKTCAGAGADQCTACGHFTSLTLAGTCVSTCPTGQFPALDMSWEGARCRPCGAQCDRCTNEDTCTECASGWFIHSGVCLEECPPSTVSCAGQLACHDCEPGCAECVGQSTGPGHCQAACNRCQDSLFLHPSTGACLETCSPTAVALDPDTGRCTECQGDCRTCFGQADWCTSCGDPRRWLWPETGTCVEECPSVGYHRVPGGDGHGTDAMKVCHACMEWCDVCELLSEEVSCSVSPEDGSLSCDLKSRCLSCAPSFFKVDGGQRCTATCPARTFAEPRTQQCLPCSEECADECTGQESQNCTGPGAGDKKASQRLAVGLGVGLGVLALVAVAGVVAFVLLRGRKSSSGHDALPISLRKAGDRL